MKRLSKIIFLFLFLITGLFVKAQTYDFRNFNVEDGLAQSQVLSICQDKNGNIWFGTNSGGVSKYDGNKFLTYSEKDSLIDNVVFSITSLKNGTLLFGTNGGLSSYNGKTFTNYTEKNGLPHSRVFKTIQDNSGTIWIATSKGVCQLVNGKIKLFTNDTLLNKSVVFTMYADKAGNIWFGTFGNGLIKYHINSNKFNYFYDTKGLSDNNSIRAINEDMQGNIYVGANSGIRKIYSNGTIEKVNIMRQENIGFSDIVSDNENNLWLATNEGVFKFNGYSYKKIRESNGLASNNLYSAFRDREGNLWFGTDGFGVSKLNGEAFFSYSSKDSLPGDYIESIFQDSQKNIWLSVKDFGVCKLQKNKIINYRLNPKDISNSLVDNEVQSICEDNQGNFYFGTKDGLSLFDGKRFRNYKMKDGLPNNCIFSIVKGRDGKMWIGTADGLCSFNNGKFEKITATDEVKAGGGDLPVYCIFEDRNHNLWLACENGVILYNGKKAVKYNKSKGFTDKRVTSIVQDKNGYLWFGTYEGLFNYNYSSFENIDERKGLISNTVYLMVLDGYSLWAGSNKGLDRLNLQRYHSINKVEIKHYGKEDGLKGIECNSNSVMRDFDGNLWFGTIKGVTVYNHHYDKINHEEAITRITGIRLFFQNANPELKKYSKGLDSITNLPENLVLPYYKNHITFDFIGVCITNPGKVKYQFKLDGADADWFLPTSKTEATYSSLPAGEYTFHLKAMNNDGLWNEKDVTFKFTILPPWWKTWWFYSLIAIFSFAMIYAYITIHTRNLEKAKVELEQEVELRTYQLRKEKEKVERINLEVIEQKAIIEAKNHDITDSIKYAKNIQEALLPPLQNLLKELNQAFVLYMPKDIVSGDFYWFAKRNKKRYIASVDCTGHGVPGAFMSIIGNTLLNEIVSEKNIVEPAEILNELHIGVKTALKQSNSENERRDGMDLALCALNEDSTILEYAGANRPLWIFRNNKQGEEAFEMIKANKFPIGGLEMDHETKRMFTNHIIPVEKGDAVYIFSDGFADQFGGSRGKKFMLGNMQKLVATIHQKPIREQEVLLQRAFLEWKGELEQIDDVLVIGFII